MDIQVSPRRTGTVSVSDAVAEAHCVIMESNLPHMLHPMGTCIEGEADQLYAVAARIHSKLIEMGFPRIGIHIRIDDRRDKQQNMEDKMKRVRQLIE